MSEIMQKCATCRFRYVEKGQMFCAKEPPAAAPIVIQRPAPQIPMLGSGAPAMEMQIQWVSSMRPVTKEMGCWQHEPEPASMPIRSASASVAEAANG